MRRTLAGFWNSVILAVAVLEYISTFSSVSAVCDFSFVDRNKLYNYSLASPIRNFPHGVRSEDGYYKVAANGTTVWFQLCDGMIFNHHPPVCFDCMDCGGPSRCGMGCSALVAEKIGGYPVCTTIGSMLHMTIDVMGMLLIITRFFSISQHITNNYFNVNWMLISGRTNMADKKNPHNGVLVKMWHKGYEYNCSLTVSLLCDSKEVQGPHLLEKQEKCDYTATLKHPSGCANILSVHGDGLGWFGAGYRYYSQGIRGIDVIPNLDIWASIPHRIQSFFGALVRKYRGPSESHRASYSAIHEEVCHVQQLLRPHSKSTPIDLPLLMRATLRSHIDRRTLNAIRNILRSIQAQFTPLLTMSASDSASLQDGDRSTSNSGPPQFEPLQPATPISYPLKTLEELESRSYFDSFHYPFNIATVSLGSRELPDRPRMLVCHDMAGGYGDDKWVQGGDNGDAYAIWHWYLIDVFVYFSHSLVSLPPPGWVNTAHRHGVKVLGTFITEWDEGRDISNKLLATKESAHMYADRLAELAAALGFDGWLINMEVQLDKEQIPNLKEFVSHLTEKMHAGVSNSLVIWYDSVTIDGKLSWQDQLNDNNKPFFDICDGIFVNYTWKETYPKLSGLTAGDRKFDIYMGIDAFGRGSYGGGQWNTNVALEVLKQERISAAIFAPGWGRGFHFSADGMRLSDKQWCNISLQSLQPFFTFSEDFSLSMEASVNLKEASYSGGGSITFKGTLEDEAYSVTRLFQGELYLGDSPVTFTYSIKSNESSRVGLSVDLVAKSNKKSSILLASWGDSLITRSQFAGKFTKIIVPRRVTREEDAPGWIIQESSLCMKGYTLTNINAVCYKSNPGIVQKRLDYTSERQGMASENPLGFHAVLGHIMAKAADVNSIFPPQASWQVEGKFITLAKDSAGLRTLSLKIVWKSIAEPDTGYVFSCFNIFVAQKQKLENEDSNEVHHNSKSEFLGVAHTQAFYVSNFAISPGTLCLEFIIQVSDFDGTCQSLEDSPKFYLDVEG
ncbi:unnamed protein product [Rhodiola kirilowii]